MSDGRDQQERQRERVMEERVNMKAKEEDWKQRKTAGRELSDG